MAIPSGKYSIVNVSTHKSLDSNVGGASQFDGAHPRIFVWDHVPHANNHQWDIRHVEGEWYNIVAHGTNKALDGNVNVAQHVSTHPTPFLWDTVPHAHNHQWKFHKVGHDTYVIINRSNNLAIDGNVAGAGAPAQHAPSHPSPFLWTPVEHAANHQWLVRHV